MYKKTLTMSNEHFSGYDLNSTTCGSVISFTKIKIKAKPKA